MSKFKTNPPHTGKFAKAVPEKGSLSNDAEKPTFSFHLSDRDYCIGACDQAFKAALADKIRILSSLTLRQIRQEPREGHGFEKINRTQIRRRLPSFITAEVQKLDVFRFHGVKGRLIGLLEGREIQIYLVDHNLSCYPHS